ncbi:MAG: VapC toxin family PIN domain ribonuclease [Chthoniobacterales bacterium]|nr:MAG: VapC toxin family PIN domain ribonuclease [Chthoniobacterales bacterium]
MVLFEVYKRLRQQRGDRAALTAISLLHRGRVVELTAALAVAAAAISYSEKLPMADSIIVATARRESATIWTQDADFKNFAAVKYRAKRS